MIKEKIIIKLIKLIYCFIIILFSFVIIVNLIILILLYYANNALPAIKLISITLLLY